MLTMVDGASLTEAPPAPVLSRVQLFILRDLADHGPTRAGRFNEEELDRLFKMRPRLIALVRGFNDAVVDITGAGRQELIAAKR
jgi:hypothetical protein